LNARARFVAESFLIPVRGVLASHIIDCKLKLSSSTKETLCLCRNGTMGCLEWQLDARMRKNIWIGVFGVARKYSGISLLQSI
jgi:hypothetical protein